MSFLLLGVGVGLLLGTSSLLAFSMMTIAADADRRMEKMLAEAYSCSREDAVLSVTDV
jgi:hypothetical protein